MKKILIVLLIPFFAVLVQAGTIIFGQEAKIQFEELFNLSKSAPDAVVVVESIYFGSDTHPEWGKLLFTDLIAKDGSGLRCWKEDYYEAQEVVYGCDLGNP